MRNVQTSGSPKSLQRTWLRAALPALLVVAGALLPFLPTLRNAFVWDDHVLIERNPALERPFESFGEMVAMNYTRTPYYRPVSVLWWSLLRNVLGFGPAGFHASNILLHAAASLLVFLVGGRLLLPGAALAAGLLFAVHPVHVEPVAFASAGGTELLPAAFFLGALWLLLGSSTPGSPGSPSPARVWGAATLYLLALLSKEMAVGLPLLFFVILLRCHPRGGISWAAAARKIFPFGAMAALYTVLRLQAMANNAGLPAPTLNAPVPWQVPSWLLAVVQYLIFPHPQLPYHDLRPLLPAQWLLLAILLAAFAWVVLGLGARRAWDLPVVLGLGLLLITVLPAAPLLPRSGALFAYRFLYLPSAGYCLLAGAFLESAAAQPGERRRRAAGMAGALLVLTLGLWSFARATDWQNEVTLVSRSLARDPHNVRLLHARAALHVQAQQPALAEPLLAAVLAQDPGHWESRALLASIWQKDARRREDARGVYQELLASGPPASHYYAWFGLGGIKFESGLPDRGEKEFLEAMRADPLMAEPLMKLAEIAEGNGDLRAAADYRERVLAMDTENPFSLVALALDRWRLGERTRALSLFLRAEQHDPALAAAYTEHAALLIDAGEMAQAGEVLDRGAARLPLQRELQLLQAEWQQRQGNLVEAERIYRRILTQPPPSAKAWFGLGSLRLQAGFPDGGEKEFLEALRIEPGMLEALVNLGEIAHGRGDRDSAARYWGRGFALDPSDPQLLNNLGVLARERGETEKARAFFRKAIERDPGSDLARRNLSSLPPAR